MEPNNKKLIALICGGNSYEHTVSLDSAYDIIKYAKNLSQYEYILIGIPKEKNKKWKYENGTYYNFFFKKSGGKLKLNPKSKEIFQIGQGKINDRKIYKAFLTTHGSRGEDGTIQGFLTLNEIPYLGCKIYQSAICFNKRLCKDLINSINISTVEYKFISKEDNIDTKIIEINKKFLSNTIVKINDGGSSIGCYVSSKNNLKNNILKALNLSDEILIEEYIQMREICIGILKKDNKYLISIPGEFKINKNKGLIFDYQQKYSYDEESHYLQVPAILETDICSKIKNYALKIFKYLNLNDYARLDFFLTPDNKIYFNEINTLPGFTHSSSFPLLFKDKFTFIELLEFLFN
ncbi:D-ala D-ala ligase C-terminus [seawater metagenome]|uniref:D-ala D-ala ligase C-terminus n=1 Tax=seawater metagenome TaxID=1561972 RepID=A0A5E8CK83_9ZZZZ